MEEGAKMKRFEGIYKGFQISWEDESEFTASNPHWIITALGGLYSYSIYPPYDPIRFIDNLKGGKEKK